MNISLPLDASMEHVGMGDTAKGERHVCSKPESAVNTSLNQGDRPTQYGWAGLALSRVTYFESHHVQFACWT